MPVGELGRRAHVPVPTLVAATAAALVLALGAAGCGGGGYEEVEGLDTIPDAPDVVVEARQVSYVPDRIELTVGEPVNIVLRAVDGGHDFRIDGTSFRLPLVDEGQQTRGYLEVGYAGELTFYCAVPGHREAGMEGTIVVTEAA